VKANAARTREGAPFGEPQPSGQALIVARLDNDPVTGIPGTFDPKDPTHAPFWALAPAEMAWESAPGVAFTGPELSPLWTHSGPLSLAAGTALDAP